MTESAGRSNASNSAAETSVSGLSDEFCEAVRAYAKSRNETMRVIYDEAIVAMEERVSGGETIVFPAVAIGRPYKARHIRMSKTAKSALDGMGKHLNIHRSVIFHKAVRDYLESNGVDTPP